MLGSESHLGTSGGQSGGASLNDIGMYYGCYNNPDILTRILSSGVLASNTESISGGHSRMAGVGFNNVKGLYYGGKTLSIISKEGVLIRRRTNLGLSENANVGAVISGISVWYDSNGTTVIDGDGILVRTNPKVGTLRNYMCGCNVGGYGFFFGGRSPHTNKLTVLNESGQMIVSESTLGNRPRYGIGGVGIN